MKTIRLLLFIMTVSLHAMSQHTIRGSVTDRTNHRPLPGATIRIEGTLRGEATDAQGNFTIGPLKNDRYALSIRFIGYREVKATLDLRGDTLLQIKMEPSPMLSQEVVVAATRATTKSAMTVSEITKQEIASQNTGRDLPYLLESVPSLVTTSDAGTGVGYTGLRLRGSDQTRINVTIDGIPINDPESHLLYWVNMPDLASSIEDIQVQRGVGTSTNGASAFGGSIHIKTNHPGEKPKMTSSTSYGSFNTLKTTISLGTGILNEKFHFEGRLSRITSDGYIDRATSDLKSFFLAGGYYGKKDVLRFNIISGKEVTYQSWNGVPEAALDTNRTWNLYTYDNQVDDYGQDHYQLFYSRQWHPSVTLNTAFHYTYGRGFYEQYRYEDDLAGYLLDPVIVGSDTITTTDLIRRKWLDNHFYGLTWSVVAQPRKSLQLIAGGGWNQYDGDHFGEVIWARYASNSSINHRYYDNNGLKTDFNAFLKATLNAGDKLSLFADMQYRRVSYNFTGLGSEGEPTPGLDRLDFFNPKAGLTWTFDEQHRLYASFSMAGKEPSRDDYVETSSLSRPKPEYLYDIEAGYQYRSAHISANLNYYHMIYKDQLALTGEVNDVGNYTRTNIPDSYREGLEVVVNWQTTAWLKTQGNITVSRNKIREFREYIDDYDNGGQAVIIHNQTDLSFSPNLTAFLELTALVTRKLEVSLKNRYVGRQYLDNTSNNSKTLDAYVVNDLRASIRLNPKFMKEIRLSGMINNLLDFKYESNGYTFSYLYGGERIHENYFYPQAGRNFMVMLDMRF